MQITHPSTAFVPPATASNVVVTVDLNAKPPVITIIMTPPGSATPIVDQQVIPPAMLAAFYNHCQNRIAAVLGTAPANVAVVP